MLSRSLTFVPDGSGANMFERDFPFLDRLASSKKALRCVCSTLQGYESWLRNCFFPSRIEREQPQKLHEKLTRPNERKSSPSGIEEARSVRRNCFPLSRAFFVPTQTHWRPKGFAFKWRAVPVAFVSISSRLEGECRATVNVFKTCKHRTTRRGSE